MIARCGRGVLALLACIAVAGCGQGRGGDSQAPLVSIARLPLEGAPRALIAHRDAVWVLNAPTGALTRVDPSGSSG